jgi:hypothetical protein
LNNDKSEQQTRKEFYCNSLVKQHLKTAGVPTTVGLFRDMVASGSGVNLDSSEGSNLIGILSGITFLKHPQQINVMDKSNGLMIVSIAI